MRPDPSRSYHRRARCSVYSTSVFNKDWSKNEGSLPAAELFCLLALPQEIKILLRMLTARLTTLHDLGPAYTACLVPSVLRRCCPCKAYLLHKTRKATELDSPFCTAPLLVTKWEDYAKTADLRATLVSYINSPGLSAIRAPSIQSLLPSSPSTHCGSQEIPTAR